MADQNFRTGHSAGRSTVGTLIYIVFGPLVWALHLTVMYGGHTLACNHGASGGQAAWLVTAATIAGLCLISPVMASPRSAGIFGVSQETTDRGTYQVIARWLAGLSAIAMIWSGAVVVFITACIQAR